MALSCDDCLRRDIIKALICQFRFDYHVIETAYGIRFTDYFAEDLAQMAPLVADGLVTMSAGALEITARGRLLVPQHLYVFRCLSARQPAPTAVFSGDMNRPFPPSDRKGRNEGMRTAAHFNELMSAAHMTDASAVCGACPATMTASNPCVT